MYSVIKRFFDFLLASIVYILLLPLLLPVVVLLLLTGEHYVFYFQERVGFKNRLFDIWKFATMLKDSPNMEGGIITTRNDPRMTPLGPFLRKSKINELPQLVNIIKGDMSIVGPRPVMQKSFEQYPKDVQEVIYNVRPGLTGIGSIIFRDEEDLVTKVKNEGGDTWHFYKNVIYPYKGELEKWYQQNRSFVTDLKIILVTALVLILPSRDLPYRFFKSLPRRPF